MSWGVRIVGGIFITLAAIFTERGYSAYLRRRIEEGESFSKLVSHLRGEISRYLTPPGLLLRGFESSLLSELGFISLSWELGLATAFARIKGRLVMPAEMKETVAGLLSGLGSGYQCDELARLDDAGAKLSSQLAVLKGELEKDTRLGRVLIGAAAIGAVILLI